MDNRELMHYGVKGMRWGVRRDLKKSSGKRSKQLSANDRKKNDMKKAAKDRRLLSDAELKKRIERLKMEQQLAELTEKNTNPGKAYVKEVLATSGRKVATTLATGATLYAVKAYMTGDFDIKELASYMTPKPKNK